ncbi:Bacterial type II and III secretion system protein [Gemmata obscuriglobus]|uniref:Uncharacterized protein n=1 Tax=Gemmata obscuriglobus TaxID=114 RepID=A0A2Z3H530_9BACT|nr:secretin N-terminal domain-containing protein [Gemmata obscuriglobus]AWM36714.1 hypothetical protein C1280_06555 [Gemmata obscuriglobus]QEG30637.1 Bacterial type II and III secretion system protein [Gemmata obscuriglobus]VTS09964.1 type iii secretion system outer membrane pore : Type II secretory pathway, component PulD OS=Vibrio nigripulchritudo SOn1 GN=VIBNISOn1_690011 PE=3 SV=1: Secretin: Secretin_N: Secretin [Gemmata obscuriglobus UQM 2246]
MRFRTLIATIAVLFALPVLAEDLRPLVPPPAPVTVPATPAAVAVKPQVTKVFTVAELVGPSLSPEGEKAAVAHRSNAQKLVKLVTDMVRPYSWAGAGGTGKVEYFDVGAALVVTNTADVITEVGDLLEALRRISAMTLVYEVRLVRAPANVFERAGVKAARDTALTDAQLQAVLDASQADRDASVTPFPRITAAASETATSKCGNTQTFVTGLDVTKVNGASVLVPRQTAVHLGESVTVKGVLSADRNYVHVEAGVSRTRLVGSVELIPVTTQITPVFEGGAQGKPVPFTQFVQAPDVRKESVERSAVVPKGGTLVIGSWKQAAEGRGKDKPGPELEVLALATVRTLCDIDAFQKRLTAPGTPLKNSVHKLRSVAAADAALVLGARFQRAGAKLVAEPVSNSLLVSGDKDTVEQVGKLIAELDKPLPHTVVQAMIVDVPDGFLAKCGLTTERGTSGCVLTPREAERLNDFLRAAKEKGECEVLSRPLVQVADNQTGYVQIGQNYPVALAGGKVESKFAGTALRVTPCLASDGQTVKLTTEVQNGKVIPGTVMTAFVPGTTFPVTTLMPATVCVQEVRANVAVPAGHTAVVAVPVAEPAAGGGARSGSRTQTIVVLTPTPVVHDVGSNPAGVTVHR